MCGVIGVRLNTVDSFEKKLVENVLRQTQIRGKHATGVSFVQNGQIKTVKEPIPVSEFLKLYSVEDWINEDGGLYLVAHARYSTSDLRYNQPLYNDEMSIVHNGVVTQQPLEEWKYATETLNDSELILKSFENEIHPLMDFPTSSMSVCVLSRDKSLRCFRNHERPLWYNKIESGYVFTSTKDISVRSGLSTPLKTEMFREYVVDKSGMNVMNYFEKLNYDPQDLQ